MLDWADVLSVALAFLVVTVSPGPANIAVATVAMRSGRRNGLLFGAGLSFGLAFWGLVAATGMGAILQGSAHLFMALKIGGGLYLLWLAFRSGRSAVKASDDIHDAPGQGRLFIRGLTLNFSNPKAVIAWMTAFSIGLGAGDQSAQVIVATMVCTVLGFLNYAAYATAFSLPGLMSGYKRSRRWIDGIVSGLFAAGGFGLIRSALAR